MRIAYLVFLSMLSSMGFAQTAKYSNAFLNIGVDARALGMSNSVVGHVGDATAGYWNPAGLARIEGYDFAAMHAEYFAGIAQYDYLSGVMPISTGVVGISLIRFGVDNILNTTRLIDENGNVDYNRITRFSAADYAMLVSYARTLGVEGLSVGGNVKVIYRQIGDFADAFGFGLDAGVQYRTGKWAFGATVHDVTTTVNSWVFNTRDLEDIFEQTGNDLPQNGFEITLPRMQLGGGYSFDLNDNIILLTELNAEVTFDGERNTLISSSWASVTPMFGFEIGWKKLVFLRGGVGNFQKETDFDGSRYTTFQPNIGVGFSYYGISIDYALTDIGDQSGAVYSNVFSLKFHLDKKR